METLKEIVLQEMRKYSKPGLNCYSHLLISDEENIFVNVTVGLTPKKEVDNTFADLVVRIVDNKVIILHDANNKPLVDALVQAGIPREQIILVYAGETPPDAVLMPL